MEYALEERIGDPDLFTGRKNELTFFPDRIKDIKKRKSQSTAILAHHKMGKTALEIKEGLGYLNQALKVKFFQYILTK
jgi:hypothetical protein